MKKTPPQVGDTVEVNAREETTDGRPMFWKGTVERVSYPEGWFSIRDHADSVLYSVHLDDIATDDPPANFNP